ncbi:M20 family metallopeptidase [Desertibaculum subflavum]|uniref:M20 family metallopeptidase n=1 Tax=Desertibaculum subflavum TaxID=2268458 RepID=UPI000E6721E1
MQEKSGRDAAIARALAAFDDGRFLADLERRIAIPTESQNPERRPVLRAYLEDEMRPSFERLGFKVSVHPNPKPEFGPFLIAERIEDPARPTVFTYGHGDVIRGQDNEWREGLAPWRITREGDRLYGRGTADNKGQHSLNMAALEAVIGARGKLGFNVKALIETGEETGSPGLNEFCAAQRSALKADVLIASDGPRVTPTRPTLFLGTRGAFNFDLTLEYREGGHHSGNWGGLLANPGVVLAHAIASMIGPKGEILVKDLRPAPMANSVRAALADIEIEGGEDGPSIDAWWGEPGFTAPEKVYGWNTLEVLAFKTGNPDRPVNAIPPRASAHCQLRFVAGCDPATFVPVIRAHLDAHGFPAVQVTQSRAEVMNATRLDPEHPWVRFAAASIGKTTGKKPAILPNLGGSLPNDVFSDTLGLPTVWVPHSYGACSQHAPNEHALASLLREGLAMMTGLFWDLGERPWPA